MKKINLFPEFVNVSDEQLTPVKRTYDSVELPGDDLLLTIFAPDPLTGVPRSDLGIVMSKDNSPEVSQFIRDNLMRPLNDNSVHSDDADFAIQSIRDRRESISQYALRLRQLVNSNDRDKSIR